MMITTCLVVAAQFISQLVKSFADSSDNSATLDHQQRCNTTHWREICHVSMFDISLMRSFEPRGLFFVADMETAGTSSIQCSRYLAAPMLTLCHCFKTCNISLLTVLQLHIGFQKCLHLILDVKFLWGGEKWDHGESFKHFSLFWLTSVLCNSKRKQNSVLNIVHTLQLILCWSSFW